MVYQSKIFGLFDLERTCYAAKDRIRNKSRGIDSINRDPRT